MTATGALIARHVTDLFPTQTSRFDLAQAARRGVISPLRCIRIPPGPGVRTIAKVPLRRGEVDTEFDQEMLAELLDQTPFNLAIADLYKTRFNGVPGVVYTAGVRHAYNVAQAFRDVGIKAQAVSGETPKRELARILAEYERGTIDVLVNAQLLAEGWNSPRATVCMHLAPTASKRIYQQRVGRVTRRHPGKEAGIVIDFVHPATKHDDPVVTLHSLLDRDVYRGGAIVVGPVRRGRGRRVRVERRVLPVTPDPERRAEVFERELWRIAVEHLDYGEQHVWAALAGARVAPNGWRRAKAMLHFDRQGELKRRFLITAVQRNRNAQLRLRALQEIAAARDAEAFDEAIDLMATWPRDERREGVKIMLQALAEKRIGRRDQANAWIWRMAEYTREVHEEYAVQRWPETKRLLGLLVNSSGGAHARNARRLVHAARKQDRRLSAALLAAALAHTPEAEEALRGARTRMARKPSALARELLRNFPKGRARPRLAPAPQGREGWRRRRGRRRRPRRGGARRGPGAGRRVSTTVPRPRSPRRRTTRRSTAIDAVGRRSAAAGAGARGVEEVRWPRRLRTTPRRRRAPRRSAAPSAARVVDGSTANVPAAETNGERAPAATRSAALELVPAADGRRGAEAAAGQSAEEDAPPPQTQSGREARRRRARRRRRRALSAGGPVPRWTSPASSSSSSARRRWAARAAGRRRRRRRAVPRPPFHADLAAGERVARAVGVHRRARASRPSAVREAREQRREHRLDVGRRAAERRRQLAQLGREGSALDGDVDADPEHDPALLRPALGEDARDLAAVEQHVVRPLDRGCAAGGVEAVRDVGDGERSEHRQQPRRCRAARASTPARGPPASPTRAPAPAAGRLRRGRHQRAVRRAARRELAARARSSSRPRGGGGGGCRATVRCSGARSRRRATSAASRPSMSCSAASAWGSRPWSRSASLVTGPIETSRGPCASSAPPAACRRFARSTPR